MFQSTGGMKQPTRQQLAAAAASSISQYVEHRAALSAQAAAAAAGGGQPPPPQPPPPPGAGSRHGGAGRRTSSNDCQMTLMQVSGSLLLNFGLVINQFYSVDFSQSRTCVKSPFSTNAQSRSASVVVDGVLGPPRLARHT